MPVPAVAITAAPLDLQSLTALVTVQGDGAVASFVGVVRDENLGRRVLFLEYEAYEALAIKAIERIVGEARLAWPDTRLARASSDRPAGDRRGEHHHRRRVAAPRARVRGVPLCD